MRGKGEGTIYKSSTKGLWIAQYYNEEGKRKTVSGKTRKEVQQKLTKSLAELQSGVYMEPSEMALEDYFKDYMQNVKRLQVQRTTFDSYNENLERYLYGSALSTKPIGAVTTDMLQRFYNQLMNNGLGNRTTHYLYSILNGGFESARKRRLIAYNPNKDVTLPKKAKSNIVAPNPEDMKAFMQHIKEHHLYALWRILIMTGIRKSEALAIQKEDINFETGEIILRYSIGYIRNNGIEPNNKAKRVYILKEDMKNDASKGNTYVDKETLTEIKKLIEKREKQRSENKEIYHDKINFLTAENKVVQIKNSVLFVKEDGSLYSGRGILEQFQSILKKYGLEKYTVHQLRHYFATQVLEMTGDIALTSSLCRHSDVSTTAAFYVTHRDARKVQALEAVQAKMGK